MRKLLVHDKKLRTNIQFNEKKHFVLKSIYINFNFSKLIRWNAFFKLKNSANSANSKIALVARCLETVNRKRFNKSTVFSRHVFLKFIRNSEIVGVKKASW